MSKHKPTITTTKERTFNTPQAAVTYARKLEAKGDISKAELRGVERHLRASTSKPNTGERPMNLAKLGTHR